MLIETHVLVVVYEMRDSRPAHWAIDDQVIAVQSILNDTGLGQLMSSGPRDNVRLIIQCE